MRRHLAKTALLGAGICQFLCAAACVAAEPNAPADLVADFSRHWTDDGWRPSGRKYMRDDDDAGWKKRMVALRGLVRDEQAAGKTLQQMLRNGTPPERILAAQAIGYTQHEFLRADLERAVQHDENAAVRLYAADSLGMLGGNNSREVLERLAKSERNRDVKRHLGYALQRNGAAVADSIRMQLRNWNLGSIDSAELGEPAPDFELKSIDGSNLRLSDFRGKKAVVLVFVYGDT